MQLGKIKQLYDIINGINPAVKTVIILLLAGIIAGSTVRFHTTSILEDYIQRAVADKKTAEQYTQIISPMVNEYIQEILLKDMDLEDVQVKANMKFHKGMLWGNLLGLGIVALQYFTQIIPLDAAVYYVSYVPMAFPWGWLAALNVGVLLVAWMIMLAPSAIVSQISPARVMHFEQRNEMLDRFAVRCQNALKRCQELDYEIIYIGRNCTFCKEDRIWRQDFTAWLLFCG